MIAFKRMRLKLGISIHQLAKDCEISETSLRKIEQGEAVSELTAWRAAMGLSRHLDREYSVDELEIRTR